VKDLADLYNKIFLSAVSLPSNYRRAIILSIDIFLILFSTIILYYLGLNFDTKIGILEFFQKFISNSFDDNYMWIGFIFAFLGIPLFIFTGQYRSLLRYTGSRVLYLISLRILLLILISLILGKIFNLSLPSLSGFLFLLFFLTSTLTFYRLVIRDILIKFGNGNKINSSFKSVLIYGAGEAGVQLSSSLKFDSKYKLKGFIDDDPNLWKCNINGRKIISPNQINLFIKKIDYIFLAIPSLSKQNKKRILNKLSRFNIKIMIVPSLNEITSGKKFIEDLKPITVSDLLGREIAEPDIEMMRNIIFNKTICVTGCGGSIGSEICREIIKYFPKKLILIDNSESSLYEINQELTKISSNNILLEMVLGDVKASYFINSIFNKEAIDIVFHAAAYKHVPIVEINPIQGIYNNVFSTKVICEAAIKNNIPKIIFISTDKAVRPTNIMGASKRLAEQIVQFYSQENENLKKQTNYNKSIFSIVRFGNVLGSSGSVVPLFQKQIDSGGPITLTHDEMQRFFMTIKEAAQLVIQSVALAEGGEVFLLDMGIPVKIIDLAEKMIKLNGLSIKNKKNPSGDIEIVLSGIRPGEKLYEELLIDSESIKTKHSKIFRGNDNFYKENFSIDELNKLEENLRENNIYASLKILKKFVPEWSRDASLKL
tara:strand:- start:3574 stop:5538 length:1965 start_codon:yes stop_codon:yes gene_type:complete